MVDACGMSMSFAQPGIWFEYPHVPSVVGVHHTENGISARLWKTLLEIAFKCILEMRIELHSDKMAVRAEQIVGGSFDGLFEVEIYGYSIYCFPYGFI